MERCYHDDRSTAFRVVAGEGNGPTTLYVHGSGGSHQVWTHQYALDGPAHPAAALDLSGHGDSEDFGEEEPNEALDIYARDTVAVADAIDADILVGNSMGGAVVLTVALDDFDGSFDPAAIVLAGTGPRLPVDETLRRLLEEDFEAAVGLLHGEDVLFHDVDKRTIERSKEMLRSAGQNVVRRDFAACHAFDVRDRLEEIDIPALALVGEHDRLTPPAYHRDLAEKMSACRYRELPDAAHMAMLDRPMAFNEAVRALFGEIEVGRFN